jgi:hypothetical protein
LKIDGDRSGPRRRATHNHPGLPGRHLTANQLETDLRSYAREFEARPYKVGTAKVDWEKVPQDRMFAFAKAVSDITHSPVAAFFKGELTASQAALKVAPFFLMWPGYDMDPPSPTPLAQKQTEELLAKIGEYRD